MSITNFIIDLAKRVLSNVITWIIITLVSPVLLTLLGFKWKLLFDIIWNYKSPYIYVLVICALFIVLLILRKRALRKVTKHKNDIPKEFQTNPDFIPESYDHSEFKKVIDKFRYQDVLWEISLPCYERLPVIENGIYIEHKKDDVDISKEPICPDCETTLESTYLATGFGNPGGKWKCLNEGCQFEKDATMSFESASEKALKAWKSQNAAKFQ